MSVFQSDLQFDWLIVNSKTPCGSSNAQESLDLALASASFDQNVALLFTGDGVYQLLQDQNHSLVGRKHLLKMLAAAPIYGLESVYVDHQSLSDRGLSPERLIDTLSIVYLELGSLAKLYRVSRGVIRF